MYQAEFVLFENSYYDGYSLAYLFVNGVNKFSNTGQPFKYALGPDSPAKFLVQTIPQTEGKLKIKAQFVNDDGSKQEIFEYTTSVPEDGIAPFGITYAVFGTTSPTQPNAATYSFKDGNNILGTGGVQGQVKGQRLMGIKAVNDSIGLATCQNKIYEK